MRAVLHRVAVYSGRWQGGNRTNGNDEVTHQYCLMPACVYCPCGGFDEYRTSCFIFNEQA